VLAPLGRDRVVVDDEPGPIALRRQGEADDRVHAAVPDIGMGIAEPPRLHDPLPRHELDLPALDPAVEQRERRACARLESRCHARRRGEHLAVGQIRVDLHRRRVDEGVLLNRHGVDLR
jgi:hypothetical protein